MTQQPVSINKESAKTYLPFFHVFLAIIFVQIQECQGLAKAPFLRRIRSVIPSNFPLSLPWYENGLEFSCTGCSKCCQVDGDVWLAPEEVANIITYLRDDEDGQNGPFSMSDFRKKYVRAEIAPADGDPSESWMCLKRNEGACTFLDSSGKCGIYDVRPVQCSTYPFWPSLLEDPEIWRDESVLPDNVSIEEGSNDRHWSPEFGGCEGIGSGGIGKIIDAVAEVDPENLNDVDLDLMLKKQEEITIVQREEIIAKRKKAKKHWRRFPGEEIKQSTWYL
jgi:Fe-S-cluster containining protein